MKAHSFFHRSIAILFTLPLVTAQAVEDIFQIGTEWLTPANWSLGVLPGPNDNARVTATGTLGIAGPTQVEVQDVAFAGTAATTLMSTGTQSAVLILNGGRGISTPLIQTGAAPVIIAESPGLLSLLLKASGEIRVGAGGLNIQAEIEETGGSRSLTKTGLGTLTLSTSNFSGYSGTTVVAEGALILAARAGGSVINGDIIVQSGSSLGFGGNSSTHIADTASVTLNGGTMNLSVAAGNGGGGREAIGNLTVNGGTFLSSPNIAINPSQIFNVIGLLKMTAGEIAAQRGGGLRAGTVEISGGAVNLDGSSTSTPNTESRLSVGTGGLTLTGGTINFNTASTLSSSARGSILFLGGNLTSVGSNSFNRLNAAVVGPKAVVDLLAAERVFNVTGSLAIGTAAAPISVINGSVTKAGAGTLTLPGVNTNTGTTNIDAGTLALTGSTANSARIEVDAGATFDVTASHRRSDGHR